MRFLTRFLCALFAALFTLALPFASAAHAAALDPGGGMMPAFLTLGVTALAVGMATTGSYTIDDLLNVENQTVKEFDEDEVAEVLRADLEAFNENVQEMLSELVEFTTQALKAWGGSMDGDMQKVDEFGSGTTERQKAGGNVGFPLHRFYKGVGWTRDHMHMASPADMAKKQISVEKGYLSSIRKEIRSALFLSSNYTFSDHHVDDVDIGVKRLVNGDGADIPNGPNNESFDGTTHTHYLATNGLSEAAAKSHINDVAEHGHDEDVRYYINKAQESAVRGFADFEGYVDPRLVQQEGTPQQPLSLTNINNRAIGVFHGAEVWVKPWVPADYQFAYSEGDDRKPLNLRQHPVSALQGLRLAFENEDYPLRADEYEAYFGVGVWQRTNGAAHYSGGGAYVDPSF